MQLHDSLATPPRPRKEVVEMRESPTGPRGGFQHVNAQRGALVRKGRKDREGVAGMRGSAHGATAGEVYAATLFGSQNCFFVRLCNTARGGGSMVNRVDGPVKTWRGGGAVSEVVERGRRAGPG